MKKIIILALATIILTSCNQNLFNFTIVSTKSIDLEKLSSFKKSAEKVTGEDKTSIIIIIPTKSVKIDQAITNTIDAIPGCVALMDGTVYSKLWFIPYIYGEHKIVIEATPIIDPSFNQSASSLPKYGKVFIDKAGNVEFMESISETAYTAEKRKIVHSHVKI